jgi:anti-sigma regulatory factor (Ser/Thr protein kinase)
MPFVTEGVAAGEAVAVAVPGRQLAMLRAELDAELGAAEAHVQLLDMTVVGGNPGRIIPEVLRAFADQHINGRVRIIGEPIWAGRSDNEYPACVQHEALINLAFAGRAVSILCPYDTAALPDDVIADATATHPVLIDSAGQRDSGDFAPERIISRYNQPLLAPQDCPSQHFDPNALAALRTFVTQSARGAGLTQLRINDVVLAAVELATNSIEHGSGSGTARMWTADGQLICQVEDQGRLTDPLAGRRPAPPEQFRGRGLLLVNHLADLVRVHVGDGGTAVRAHFSL